MDQASPLPPPWSKDDKANDCDRHSLPESKGSASTLNTDTRAQSLFHSCTVHS